MGLSIFSAAFSGSDFFWIVVLGSLGGFVCGLGALYSSAYRQWPLLKRYVNAQSVRDDFTKNEP